eukprot:TRINITY_DN49435_c0_g1_i1.p1 TRINITY_DN49435_c0_g1~~TRINITY_DN49435_c0_g1_i1.p1  ORF type:complete len:674 (-),score=116.86 TRINITY_DN49435_c0_g1_i1:1333-3156(-)
MQKLHQQTFAQKQRAEVVRNLQKAGELLQGFEEGINFTQLKKFNVAKYMIDCNQEMGIRELTKPDDTFNSVDMQRVLETLKGSRGEGQNAAAFDSYMQMALEQTEKIIGLFSQSKLDSLEWAKVIDPLLVLLRDVMHQTPPKAALVEAEEDVKRMKFNIEECSQAQAQAIADGEMKEAETFYYKKIEMQETISDLVKKKFELIDKEEVTAFKIPIKRVHETHNKANIDISNILKKKERLRKRAEDDLGRLLNELEKVNLEDYNATKHYVDDKEKSSFLLKENMQQQEACWKKIEEMEKELMRLGQARFDEVKRRTKLFEREEKRRVEYQHFLDFCNQHKQLLELTITNCETAEEITDTLDALISSGCNTIERRLREIEKEMEEERLATHDEYFQSFRKMYLTIGDLQYKKERHIEELEKKIQTAHIQQEFYMETFNPKAKEWSNQKKELQGIKQDMENQVGTLRGKGMQYVEWFQPSEKALIEAGREFKHPVEELKEINETRQNKLIEYHELMTRQDDDEAEYAQELAEIEKLRSLVQYNQENQVRQITMGPGSASTTPSYKHLAGSLSMEEPAPSSVVHSGPGSLSGLPRSPNGPGGGVRPPANEP